MTEITTDTIFAQASGPGRAGVLVMRISGPGAPSLFGSVVTAPLPAPRQMERSKFTDPETAEIIDDGLVVFFPAPNSFTGEDVVELHLHGSVAIAAVMTEILSRQFRIAEPGEFTRRAFENGKMDLTAAEGLADLVDAETEGQRKQAFRQMQGELGCIYENWRNNLVEAIANFEAQIDFSDEDIPADLIDRVALSVEQLKTELSDHLDDDHRGELTRDGLFVAIIGPPNAGKSTLLNRLARRDVAIVSATAGTTRDVIETRLDLGGFPVIVADTAGLTDSDDAIESEGVRRALARAEDADLKLVVLDGAVWPDIDPTTHALIDDRAIVVLNKIDLGPVEPNPEFNPITISAEDGTGLEELLGSITQAVVERCGTMAGPSLTRTRHRRSLEECLAALQRFDPAGTTELAAEDLRLASRALGQVTGRVGVEDILDVIFMEFCIGK